ncbi:MAG: hypothetical protein LBR26_16910 [Prevotella sp.]|nr:hypothetical protein [Prevotella sp.]
MQNSEEETDKGILKTHDCVDFGFADFQFNSIQIVALQENPFNTKGAKRITNGAKHFLCILCRFCGFFALKILEYIRSTFVGA